jgi:hypothetical protein
LASAKALGKVSLTEEPFDYAQDKLHDEEACRLFIDA